MKASLFAVFAALAISLASCGGGGGGGSSSGSGVIPNGPGGTPVPSGSPAPQPSASTSPPPGSTHTPTPAPGQTPPPTHTPTPAPGHTPSPSPSPVHTPTPAPSPSTAPPTPPPSNSIIPSTVGRIGLAQIFDYFPSDGTTMSSSQISSDASRYDLVWGSFNPQPWRSANPRALVSRYYIVSEDNIEVSGNNLSWWQQNHPDWILYACDSSGNPTHDYAYTPGDGFADVPLDIHNPNVIQYQVQSLKNYIVANGYNAMALDEVIFHNYMLGGNPKLGVGQSVVSGEYGCGTYNADGSFNRVYSGPNDPTFTADILNWVSTARQTAKASNLSVIVNHPAGSTSNANEQALLGMVDATLDENGFSDYGNYPKLTSFFNATLAYMKYVQSRGVAFVDIDKFAMNGETSTVPSNEREYAIATYLMGNEGAADMFIVGNNGAGYGYGAEQYYPEYTAALGTPCAEMYGGSSYDPSNPQIYYRKFSHGLSIVNSGSAGPETAKLPAHTYSDIESRPVSGSTLTVNNADAYVLLTSGNGCQ